MLLIKDLPLISKDGGNGEESLDKKSHIGTSITKKSLTFKKILTPVILNFY